MMQGMTDKRSWRKALGETLPGEQAQLGMAPEFRGEMVHESDPVPAAVMILMYPEENATGMVFIKRNTYDGAHSAQVSFPGGIWESSDQSLEQTAVRETREELGIIGEIHLLGSLTQLHIPVSNFMVRPFAGWMDQKPIFHPDPSEVQYVIETSMEDLLNPANIMTDYWEENGRSIKAPYYRVGNEKIWGATAMMLCEFLQVASRLQ
jgi:8-oxo-dGTP pyrophosphatase MutT (NUDIX family)